MEKYIQQGVSGHLAGVSVYIHAESSGEWIRTAGYAAVASRVELRESDVFSLASIGKMYTAVAVMKLKEEGKLGLDDPIRNYLPESTCDHLPNSDRITIRHLLSHQSGLANYENDPELNSSYIAGRLKLDTLDHLTVLKKYVFDRPALNTPGAAFHYSSTNYLLLAMLMDQLLPEGHTAYVRALLGRHRYVNTWYRQTPERNNIHYYGDTDQNGEAEDLTLQTFETTNWFMGDDGIYATIDDAAHFLQDLVKGKIVNAESFREMQEWNDARKPDYGLGLMADKSFPYGFLLGHSGRGIGVTTDLYYFPRQGMTVAIFCNTGLRGASPEYRKEYNKMRARIVKKLFLF